MKEGGYIVIESSEIPIVICNTINKNMKNLTQMVSIISSKVLLCNINGEYTIATTKKDVYKLINAVNGTGDLKNALIFKNKSFEMEITPMKITGESDLYKEHIVKVNYIEYLEDKNEK